jgi:GTP-binding protein Era
MSSFMRHILAQMGSLFRGVAALCCSSSRSRGSTPRGSGLRYNVAMNRKKSTYEESLDRLEAGLARAWKDLPQERRRELRQVLRELPQDLKGWRGLIDQVLEQVRFAAGEKRQIAILEPANVGKSTLYNVLLRPEQVRARVSAIPGTTRETQTGDAGLFTIVDTPGADNVGAVGLAEKERALEAARRSDYLVILFDASHGIRDPERKMFFELKALDIPLVAALNKMDLVQGERAHVLKRAAQVLAVEEVSLIPLIATKGEGIERLLREVVRGEPELVAALGVALPEYRWILAQSVILRAASTAAAVALTPLPFVDFIPLTGLQIAIVLGLARVYAYEINLARARELLATFGAALLGRTLFYELGKLGGPPGWLVAAGVAAGTTAAVGYGAALWFERGERLSKQALQRISRAISESIVLQLKDLGRRRPDRKTLRTRVLESLKRESITIDQEELDSEGKPPL